MPCTMHACLQLVVLLRQYALRLEQHRLPHLRPVRLGPRCGDLRLSLGQPRLRLHRT